MMLEVTEAEAKFIVRVLDEYAAQCERAARMAHRIAAGLSENEARPLTVRKEQD